ncbi:FimV/HubP family polar landmark protein [Roseateles chitosanitabidus]|uniref:FimV/HubP family polar landmark protein n=1 Tax=Roseateles chitosanitabidus TaxID=65048 RepID=UPI00235236F1|nr:FimV/HubP family polar landmark protein [Roseateles chitosanitabidus]
MAAVTALGLATGSAWGLGLGKLTVQSALGETLRAEIDVSSLSPEEATSLKLRVAPPDSYRASGLDYNPVLSSAQVQLARRPDGRPYLRLSSDRAVQEPFVDVILELSWSSGRLTREFTLLFDPPSGPAVARAPEATTSPVISAPAPTAPAVASAPVARSTPSAASESASRTPATPAAQPPAPAVTARPRPAAPAPAPAPAAAATAASEYTVKPGDTLSRIASRTQPTGVSLDQMLVGLYRSNPDAFINQNMNRLKSGAVLAVPDSGSVQAITPTEARRVIQAQSSDFGGYRQRLAEGAPALKAEENARQAKGSVQAAVEDRKPAAAPSPDKLTLSKPGAAAETANKVSKETEKKDSAARVAELTRNVEELKKLSAAAKPGTPAPAPAPTPAPAPASAPVVPPVTVAANVPASAAPATPASAPASAVVAAAPASRPAAASAPKVMPAPQPEAEEPSFLDSLSDYLPALGAALAVIVGGVVYNRWRARRDAASRSETAFAESRLAPDSFFGHSGGQRVDTRDASTTGQSSMSYSLSQLDAIGDVDPVAEADVYLAYGRDLQAEEILKEALRANPERLAIRLKLLEVYGKRRDIKGFEQLAVQLYAETKGQGEDWAKVQELGRQADPDNPLYQPGGTPVVFENDDERPEPMNASTLPATGLTHPGSGAVARAAATAAAAAAVASSRDSGPSSLMDLDLDLDLGSPPAPAAAMAATQALPTSASQAPLNMDLDLSAPSAAPTHAPTSASAHELEFDLGDLDDLGGTPPAPAAAEPGSLDFDLSNIDLDLPSVSPTAGHDERTMGKVQDVEDIDAVELPDLDMAAHAPAPSSDTMSLDDLGVDLDSIDPNDDEALQRQLELAEEFRQIGDTEGARDVLQELVGKASGPLKDRAQLMLDSMR